ncbi:hypothetical protein [Paraburkholderia sp.]|uniref:hypothetical protein n=1 Tax=Paraburkholderia sp. TaxID=1926495 RepID=UPI003D6E4DAB
MDVVRDAWGEWRWLGGVVARVVVALAVGCVSMVAGAQTSALGLNAVVCGPVGASGVAYVMANDVPVSCGTDASGNAMALQVAPALVVAGSASDTSGSGVPVGAEIGGAVLGVMGLAYGFRVLRNFINSSSEG